jgi:hypothetical protein
MHSVPAWYPRLQVAVFDPALLGAAVLAYVKRSDGACACKCEPSESRLEVPKGAAVNLISFNEVVQWRCATSTAAGCRSGPSCRSTGLTRG